MTHRWANPSWTWHGMVVWVGWSFVWNLKCLVGLCLEWLSFSSSTFVNEFSFVYLFSPASIQWPDRGKQSHQLVHVPPNSNHKWWHGMALDRIIPCVHHHSSDTWISWMISGFSHSYQLIIRVSIRIPWNNSQVYLQFHSVLDDWNLFGHNKIHVVFIDAAHDYASVKSDLDRALALPYAPGLAQKSWNFNRFLIFLRIPRFFFQNFRCSDNWPGNIGENFRRGGDALESACCRLKEMVPSKGNQAWIRLFQIVTFMSMRVFEQTSWCHTSEWPLDTASLFADIFHDILLLTFISATPKTSPDKAICWRNFPCHRHCFCLVPIIPRISVTSIPSVQSPLLQVNRVFTLLQSPQFFNAGKAMGNPTCFSHCFTMFHHFFPDLHHFHHFSW